MISKRFPNDFQQVSKRFPNVSKCFHAKDPVLHSICIHSVLRTGEIVFTDFSDKVRLELFQKLIWDFSQHVLIVPGTCAVVLTLLVLWWKKLCGR